MYIWPNFEYYLILCLQELRKTTLKSESIGCTYREVNVQDVTKEE